jgi:hypothetical protein
VKTFLVAYREHRSQRVAPSKPDLYVQLPAETGDAAAIYAYEVADQYMNSPKLLDVWLVRPRRQK